MSHLKIVKLNEGLRRNEDAGVIRLSAELIDGIYLKEPYSFTLDIKSDASLTDLHTTIQSELKFDNDHLFEFASGRSPRSRSVVYGNDDYRYDNFPEKLDQVFLNEIFPLAKGHALFYTFDFGDNWMVQIRKARSKPGNIPKDFFKVVSRSGKRPVQYPDFEDEEDFDELKSEIDSFLESEELLQFFLPKIPMSDKVYLYSKPIPMNWGWKKLSKIVEDEMGLEFTKDKIFLFHNRAKDRLRLLFKGELEETLDCYLEDNSFILPAPEPNKIYSEVSREKVSNIFKADIL